MWLLEKYVLKTFIELFQGIYLFANHDLYDLCEFLFVFRILERLGVP